MDKLNLLQCLLLGLTAVAGDKLVVLNQSYAWRKALCDNVTHAVIGILTWINMHYYLGKGNPLCFKIVMQSLLCGLISSVIDADHFIAARSFFLKDATRLSKRPFLHCTTLPIIVSFFIIFLSHPLHSSRLETIGWMLLGSFLSHHIRDAARRGFWLWPFGSTPPLGATLYLCLTVLLPFLLSLGITNTNGSLWRSKSHQVTVSIV